jgi:hypothetical protein
MIFSIQRDLEDHFNRCGLTDPDQYAVAVAKLYDRKRRGKTPDTFLSSMRTIRTAFFRTNGIAQRPTFERKLLTRLDGKFKKKVSFSSHALSPKELRHQANAS